MDATPSNQTSAAAIIAAMSAQGLYLAVAESLTGGALASAIVDVPGASAVFLGSIVAYNSALKSRLLDVNPGLLESAGAVDAEVARQMAAGVRARMASAAGLDVDRVVGVACTGVAGPDPQDGKPVGTVFIAADAPGGTLVREFSLASTRAEIRAATVTHALGLLAERLQLDGHKCHSPVV